jgi:fatty-acyl-CoA synthase
VYSTGGRYPTFLAEQARGRSISEGLLAARAAAGLTVLDRDLRPRRLGYRELAGLAERAARALAAQGVRPGDRVCLLGPTVVDLVVTLFGIWRLGAAAVVLPRSRRSTVEGFLEEVQRRIKAAAPALLVTTEKNTELLAGRVALPVVSLRRLRETPEHPGGPLPMPAPDSVGLVQFTSGTTAASRAVPVTQEQIVGNIAAAGERAGFGADDIYVSWLPLYHDMGIISLAGIAACGADIVTMATETFMAQPGAWLRTISDYGGTFTAAPNFAYGLAARMQALRPAVLNLSRLRVAINGAEAIDASTVATVLDVLGRSGLPATAMCPMYGLAEATLAVTGSGVDEAVRITGADGPGVATGEARPARRLVGCGRPLPGTQVRIHGPGGALPDGAVGEIVVRGPGVTPGYWTADGGLEEGQTLPGGWLATGDLGFVEDGELVVCGRSKDMVIAGGRNLYPEDYELVAEHVPGVRDGNAVVFSLPEQERMVVVVEARSGTGDLQELGERVMDALREEVEYAPHEIVFVRPGTLPKTSSGKRQRRAARTLYEEGGLEVLHTVR